MTDYKAVAEKLGIKYRIWKYGFEFLPKGPDGKIYKLFQILPLDGWTWDEHEIKEAFVNDERFKLDFTNRKE